jgi:hypothetical protein
MYQYMHTVRLYNNPNDAEVRPASRARRQSEVQRGYDYATWHTRLQPANLPLNVQNPTAKLVDFMSPEALAQSDQRAA